MPTRTTRSDSAQCLRAPPGVALTITLGTWPYIARETDLCSQCRLLHCYRIRFA